MKIIYKILFLSSLLTSLCHNTFAQCGTGTSYGSISPTSVWQNTASLGSGVMPYWTFNAVNGGTYNFSNCSGTAEDTYLRIYNSTWVQQTSNDDNGPYCSTTNASLDWACTASGTYYVFLSHFSCSNLSNNQILSYKCVIPEWTVPSSGSNSYTLTCGSTQHIYDSGGSSGNYDVYWDGYSVIYPSTAGYKIQISGTSSGEACCDYVQVYNGVGTGGSLLGTYNMGTAIPTLTSTDAGGALTIRFYSDVSIVGTGFDISVSCYNPCTAPSISVQPVSQTTCVGSSVTFSVTASGTGLNYQWRKGGSNVGSNSSSYTIASPVAGDAGPYDVVITGTCGTVTSSAVTLTVNTLSTAPTSASASINPVCAGNPTTLTLSGGSLGTGGTYTWGYGVCGPVFDEDWGAPTSYWMGATTVNSTTGGKLNVTSTSGDPMIGMEAVGSFNPSIYKYIQIRYRVISGTAGNAEIFYTNDRSAVAVGDQMVSGALISDGAWHSLTINMSAGTYWNGYGNIRGWRYDWSTNSGVTMELDNISLSIGQGTSISVNPTANTTYYVRAEGVCNATSCVNTTVNVVTSLPAIPNAGEDQYICGATTVTMAATGTGTWSMVSGPNTPNIVTTSSSTTQIGTTTGLISGTYVFRWSVSNICGVSYDDIVVIKQ